MSEAFVRAGYEQQFLRVLQDMVAPFPAQYPGLLGHEILHGLADMRRVVYVSRWRDEAALVAFAGQDWRTDPVTFPHEHELLTGPLVLRHLEPHRSSARTRTSPKARRRSRTPASKAPRLGQ